MIHTFDVAQIDHKDTMVPIRKVKALLCSDVVVVVVVVDVVSVADAGGVLERRSRYFSLSGEPWLQDWLGHPKEKSHQRGREIGSANTIKQQLQRK